jgi:hypothetical protein
MCTNHSMHENENALMEFVRTMVIYYTFWDA